MINRKFTIAPLAVAAALLLGACAMPAIEAERVPGTALPARADGVTTVVHQVPGYDGGAGTVRSPINIYGTDYDYVSGTITEDGLLTLNFATPERDGSWQVRDAWQDTGIEGIISSNPQARLVFLFNFNVYQDRERPVGWLFMDSVTDVEADTQVGDVYAGYMYASQPTTIRINHLFPDGDRYISDLNLAAGWNRVATEVIRYDTGLTTWRESIANDGPFHWQYEAFD